ncbi:MAG TPA: CinA family protein [Ferruginibacter sp.]|nr:CinA family protein [Ferruginibacter sp.]
MEKEKSVNMFDKALLLAIGKKLQRRHHTVAIAESVTSGLLQFSFSQIPDASEFFQGGFTAYNLGQKYKHLNVEPIHAAACDCVSQPVADQMALATAEQFRSDWGISITGYATPVPESGNKLFCFFSITYKNKVKLKGKITHKKDDPVQVQLDYVVEILKKFRGILR